MTSSLATALVDEMSGIDGRGGVCEYEDASLRWRLLGLEEKDASIVKKGGGSSSTSQVDDWKSSEWWWKREWMDIVEQNPQRGPEETKGGD